MLKTTKPEAVGFSSERLNLIPTVMGSHVDQGNTGGILTLVERKGETVHLSKCGYQDIASQKPMDYDHIFRIYSMSKPMVSLALMMLYEQARFHLNDPIHQYLPEFKESKVWQLGGKLVTPKTPPTILHLLTHTAGLTYGTGDTEVDEMYMGANLWEPGVDLTAMVRRIANLPLLYQPGERWVYSVATDVVGRLVEVLSGMDLENYLQEKVFSPLGMTDTSFSVPEEKVGRLTTCYTDTEKGKLAVHDPAENSTYLNVSLHSGGGGLVSTLEDYLKFSRLVLNQGELDGVRLVGRKTMELMTANHIPANLLPLGGSEPFPGYGFGLGFSVLMDPALTRELGSVGTLGWGGMASTTFWVDPLEDLIAILMTQFVPENPITFQADFRTLVYQALID